MPRMARELRRAARDSGEDVAAHHGLVKMRDGHLPDANPAGTPLGCMTRQSTYACRLGAVNR